MTSQTENKAHDSAEPPRRHSLQAFDTFGLEGLGEKSEITSEIGGEINGDNDPLAEATPPADNGSPDGDEVLISEDTAEGQGDTAAADGDTGAGHGDDPAENSLPHEHSREYLPLEEYLATDHRHEQLWERS